MFPSLLGEDDIVLPKATSSGSSNNKNSSKKLSLKLAPSANRFASNFFQRQAKNENIVVSPISIFSSLALCYAGASGTNFDEMHHVLIGNQFSANRSSLSSILSEANALISSYIGSNSATQKLKFANAVFVAPGYPISPTYKTAIETELHANVTSGISAATINNFVKTTTEGIITEIVQQSMINENTKAVLVNAVYFKGAWVHAFDKQDTDEQGAFFSFNNKRSEKPMMRKFGTQQTDILYGGNHDLKGNKFQSLTLPYIGGQFSMVFIRPKENSEKAFNSLFNALFQEKDVLDTIRTYQKPDVEISQIQIPRFKLESSMTLNDDLKAMGMNAAFTPGGFDNLVSAPNQFHIGLVLHKAFVEVNEEGTVAAAATAEVAFDSCFIPEEPKEPIKFILDSPFICLLKHEPTSTIAFAAKVIDP